jgi:tRNA-dihydrouridine synthase A
MQMSPDTEIAFSVAPMMDYTDRHQRYLFSLLSAKTVLYTEMVTTNALIRSKGDTKRFLEADLDTIPNPTVLQLGGSDPQQMFDASIIARDYGYKQININCGCPSDKVADKGCFGAALMERPDLVIALSRASTEAMGGQRPTIKCRIGVNDNESYESLYSFISEIYGSTGVNHFIIHARKAVLGANFSPHDNRNIPPLKYYFVYNLVRDFPSLKFTLNGGILNYEDCLEHLRQGVHGVMVGRSCINKPYYWRNIDSKIFHSNDGDPGYNRAKIIEKYGLYADSIEREQGLRARRALMKPLLGLFTGDKYGKIFRARLDELIRNKNKAISVVIKEASFVLSEETLSYF